MNKQAMIRGKFLIQLGIALMIVVLLASLQRYRFAAQQSLQRQLDWYQKQFKTRSGSSVAFGNYHLISFDNGKTWYNWVQDGGGITPADPELVKHITGFEALTEAAQNGPIDTSTPEGRKLLEGAGFTVEQKPVEKP